MRPRVALSALFVALVAGLAAQQTPPPEPQQPQRLAWFRDAKYGLFIHWGLYAIPAGEWNGRPVPGLGEWIMFRAPVPVREYEKLAARFNPARFDADRWVTLAKDAGMKYIVITAKHHDGFAMFASKVSPYNVVDATPFKRDVLKELADACARQNMRLGFYYSQSQDWHEPNGAGNTWDFGPDEKKDYDQYLKTKAEPQVRELLTRYGPVALVWFDTPRMMTPERSTRFTDLVRSAQPATLIDGRLGAEGDYRTTGDNVIPPDVQGQPWETPATINHTWGYRTDDTDWKSPGQILFKLIDIVSKGGNYLLNVGPMADGTIPRRERGRPPDGGPLAACERRSRVRRGRDAVRRGARRAERARHEGRPRRRVDLSADRVAGHDQTGQAVHHLLQRTARAVSPAGDEERHLARVPARRRRAGRDSPRQRARAARHRAADSRSHGDGDRRRVRGRAGRALTQDSTSRCHTSPSGNR